MCREACAILAALILTRCGGLCGVQNLVGGQSLNDDRWHSLFIRRRANVVQLGVDNSLQSTSQSLTILSWRCWSANNPKLINRKSFFRTKLDHRHRLQTEFRIAVFTRMQFLKSKWSPVQYYSTMIKTNAVNHCYLTKDRLTWTAILPIDVI